MKQTAERDYQKIAPFVFQMTQWIILVGALKAAALRLDLPLLASTATVLVWLIVYHVAHIFFAIIQTPSIGLANKLTARQALVFLVILTGFTAVAYVIIWRLVGYAVEIAFRLADAVS